MRPGPLRRVLGAALTFACITHSTAPAATQPPPPPRPELVLQTGHGVGTLWHVALSADGDLLASGGRGDNAVHLWDTTNGRQLRLLESPARGGKLNSGVSAVAFGGGSRLLGAGFTDGTLAVWDVATGNVVARWASAQSVVPTPFPVGVTSLWFDGSGERVFSAGDPAGVRVFRIKSGAEERKIAGAQPPQYWLPQALTPDARTLVSIDPTAKADGEAVVLQDTSSSHANRKKIPGSMANGRAVAATADGRVLVASIAGNTLQISDVVKGGNPRALDVPAGKVSDQSFLVIGADGRVGVAAKNVLTVWPPDGRSPAFSTTIAVPAPFPDASAITAFDFSPDGRRIAVATLIGTTVVLDSASGRETTRLAGNVNVPFAATFSPDGSRLYSGEKTIWNFAAGRGERLVPSAMVNVSAFSADGRVMITASPNSGDVAVWDLASKRQRATLAGGADVEAARLAIGRNGELAAVSYVPTRDRLESGARSGAGSLGTLFGGASLTIKIWDLASGREVRTVSASGGIGGVADTLEFSPDGRRLVVTFTMSAPPAVFDVSSGQQVASLAAPASGPQVDFGRMMNAKGAKGKANQERVQQMMEMMQSIVALRQGLSREFGSASFSPDGRLIALAVHELGAPAGAPAKPVAHPGAIEIWDAASGKQVSSIAGHDAGAARVAYTPDGKSLVTADYDNTLSLWDAASGKEIRSIGRSAANVLSLVVSPDGKLVASTHGDGATRLWDLAHGGPVATLLSLNDGADWLAVTPDGLFDGSPAAWNSILWRFSGKTFDTVPVEVFFNEYYYPDLLSDVLSGKRPHAVADIAAKDRRQAQVAIEIAGAAPGAELTNRDATVRVRVADAPAGARDLRLFRNGSLVKLWHGDALQGRQNGEFEVHVPLVAGVNHFTAYVFNRDNIKSRDAVADATGAQSLARRGVAYVIAVGINEYENHDYNLRYAVADARTFADDVKSQLERLDRFERVDVMLLADREATKAAIMKAMADLSSHVQPEDEVFVFVASHGAAAGDRFYLIPSDLGYAGKRTELDEKAVESILAHSISDQEIETAFETMNVRRLLLVIDACNSGQALEAEEKRRGPMNSKGLAQLAYEKGMYVLTASQSYQAAQEVSALGHGLLTYALVNEGLDQASADADPPDGRVLAREWLDFATSRVPRLQVEKMEEARQAGRQLRFSAGPRGVMTGMDADTQHPRVFYRRELDDAAWVVAARR